MKYLFLLLVVFLVGCTSREIPKVFFDIKGYKCNVNDVFTEQEVVFLETTKESCLGHIAKIIRWEDKIYILDKFANSVVVFDIMGKYVSAIRPSGRGPQEYTGISDFTINREKGQLIIHAHRPGKLLFYDLNCRFQNEIIYESLVSSMVWMDGRLILVNRGGGERNPYFTYLSFDDTGKISDKQSSSFREAVNSNQYTLGALLLRSEGLTFARRFDNTLYSLEGEEVIPRYILDFKEYNVPAHLQTFGDDEEEKKLELRKGGYVFSLVDVKETLSSVFFTTNKAGVMRITKTPLKGEYWYCFVDKDLGLEHCNMIGTEEPSNRMVCFYHPISFLKSDMEKDKDLFPAWLAGKIKSADEEDNPLLVFYKWKE